MTITPDPRADINRDGRVDGADLSVLLRNMGSAVQVERFDIRPVRAHPAVESFRHRRMLFVALSDTDGVFHPDYGISDANPGTPYRAHPDSATLTQVHIEALRRTDASAVFFWGSGGGVDVMPQQWSPVWPADLEHTERGAEVSDLFSMCDTLNLPPYIYVGVANTPTFWDEKADAWRVYPKSPTSIDHISPHWASPVFVQTAVARSFGVSCDGVGLDASYYICKHHAKSMVLYAQQIGMAGRTTFVEGPIPHDIDAADRIALHQHCVEIGVVNGGPIRDNAGNVTGWKDVMASPDVQTLTNGPRRAWISTRVSGAKACLMVNGSSWSTEQRQTVERLCDDYGIALIAYWL